jgi:hypothetical protein
VSGGTVVVVGNSKIIKGRKSSNLKNEKDSFLAKSVQFKKGSDEIWRETIWRNIKKQGRRTETPWQIIGM